MTARRAMATGALPPRLAGLAVVILVHGAALCGLWCVWPVVAAHGASTLSVRLIAESTPPVALPPHRARASPPARPPAPPGGAAPLPVREAQMADMAQGVDQSPDAPVAADHPTGLPPPSVPTDVSDAPIELAAELSVVCPVRAVPSYPSSSRRRGEAGLVVLRIELDAEGLVAVARVQHSSGFDRLDEAALRAVRHWRCVPQTRDGRAGRAVALQPFSFVM